MNKKDRISRINISFFAGMAAVISFCLLYGVSTSFFNGLTGRICYGIASFATGGFYLVCFALVFSSDGQNKIKKQLLKLNYFVLGLLILYTLAIIRKNFYADQKILLFSFSYFGGIVCFIVIRFQTIPRISWTQGKESVLSFFKTHIGLLILLGICGALSFEKTQIFYRWDSGLYYTTISGMNLFSVSSLAAYGHIAQAFGMLTSLAAAVADSVDTGILFMNLLVFLLSVCAFYGVLVELIPQKRQVLYTMASAIYALSPFTLGMVHYINLDFYMLCLFPILLYFFVRKEWILFFIASLFFVFTKEPAVVVYGCLCIGIVIMDFWKKKEIQPLFLKKQYYLMALCGIIWFAIYKILGPWSAGDSAVKIQADYIFKKISVLYLMNFNWILTVGTVVFLGWMIWKKNFFEKEFLLPVLLSQLGFSVFSCVFRTANHARYIDTSFVVLCLLAVVGGLRLLKEKWMMFASFICAAWMTVSCFWTVDPVTRMIFPTINVGETFVLSTGSRIVMADESLYNRQMLYLEETFQKAVASAIEENTTMILPSMADNTWYFNGMDDFHKIDEVRRADVIWDEKKQKRVYEKTDDLSVKAFAFYELSEDAQLEKVIGKLPQDKLFSYIYMDCVGAERIDKIREQFQVFQEEEYEYRGFVIKRIEFGMEK